MRTGPAAGFAATGIDNHPGHASQKSHGRRVSGKTGQAALDAAPAKLTPADKGHQGRYGDESLSGPRGMGSARALAEYEGVEYWDTNNYLRLGPRVGQWDDHDLAAKLDASDSARIAEIDRTMAASRLTEGVEVDRVVHKGSMVFGTETWHGPDWTSRDLDRADAAYDRWIEGERPDLTGVTWKEKGYVSTTADPSITSQYGDRYKRSNRPGDGEPVVMKIHAPAGTGAVQMSPMNDGSKGEGELLLERGLTMQVTADLGVDDAGLRILEVEVVPE